MNNLASEQKKALIDISIIAGAIIILALLHAHGDGWEVLIMSLILSGYLGYSINSWLKIANDKFVRPHFPIPNEISPIITGLIMIVGLHIPDIKKLIGDEAPFFFLLIGGGMWCWGWFMSLGICKNFLWVLGVFAAALISTHHLWLDIVKPLGFH